MKLEEETVVRGIIGICFDEEGIENLTSVGGPLLNEL